MIIISLLWGFQIFLVKLRLKTLEIVQFSFFGGTEGKRKIYVNGIPIFKEALKVESHVNLINWVGPIIMILKNCIYSTF